MGKKTIAVIGAGTMGAGIAMQYAMCGNRVSLYSRTQATLERAYKTIIKNCELIKQEKNLPSDESESILSRICFTTSLSDAVSDAWYVVETISERPEEKRLLYQQLDALLDNEVILSSNTSYLDIFSLIPEHRQENTAIVHWFTPAYIIPLVEIVKGPKTNQNVIDSLTELHQDCDKVAICMDRYVPGFLINRLQSAMTREVLFLIENGYCSPEAIDLAVKSSLMPRGVVLGLVQRMDFAGLDGMENGLRNKAYQPAPDPGEDNIISAYVREGKYGVKSGRGFFDYSHKNYEEILFQRDLELIRSVKLAKESIRYPLHSVLSSN